MEKPKKHTIIMATIQTIDIIKGISGKYGNKSNDYFATNKSSNKIHLAKNAKNSEISGCTGFWKKTYKEIRIDTGRNPCKKRGQKKKTVHNYS